MRTARPANVTSRRTDWNATNWQRASSIVRNLRQRIYRATAQGDLKKVRSLQKLMLKSHSNALTAVRRATQENAGKRTPGVDKLVVKTPKARGEMVDSLMRLELPKPLPTRRIHIPKSNGKSRPLGIPTVLDRCRQGVVKNALEPHWEAKFEGVSYGFRPGRGCHDALARIATWAHSGTKRKWVLDADIAGCFDAIDHSFLMRRIGNFPARKLVYQWLKAGFMDKGQTHPTETGTPQGGVVSPLLMNIALHGMEEELEKGRSGKMDGAGLVRYADDFVVFCRTEEEAVEAKKTLETWLAQCGLRLSPEKTRIVHISEGFDFLGCNVRQVPSKVSKRGTKLLIQPSKSSMQTLRDNLRASFRRAQGNSASHLIADVNPMIRGWANYFRTVCSARSFAKMDSWLFTKQVRFAKFQHHGRSWKWIVNRYFGLFHSTRNDKWVFGDAQTRHTMLKFSWTKIKRHVLVPGRHSKDDPSLRGYWSARENRPIEELKSKEKVLAKRQNGRCAHCRQSLFNGERLHKHHKVPRSRGGSDSLENLQLLHMFCHQQLHASPRVAAGDLFEPCAGPTRTHGSKGTGRQ